MFGGGGDRIDTLQGFCTRDFSIASVGGGVRKARFEGKDQLGKVGFFREELGALCGPRTAPVSCRDSRDSVRQMLVVVVAGPGPQSGRVRKRRW